MHQLDRLNWPPIIGLRTRGFEGGHEFADMARVANASFEADGLETRRAPDEMARDYASFTGCEPRHDVLMVEVAGELVAYARCWRWSQTDGLMLHGSIGFVPAPWRGRGLGWVLLQGIEQRHQAVAAQHPQFRHEHHAFVQQTEVARAALLAACGYVRRRTFFEMQHTELGAAPHFALPPSVEVRPVLPEHHRLIWDAHLQAMQDHWGAWSPGPDEFDAWRQGREFQPQHWQIAWDLTSNTVVGQVRTFINDEQNRLLGRRRGYTEYISVLRPWRQRGLARALVAESLRTLARAGMTESALGVDSENLSGATRLYEDCGFRVMARNAILRKPLMV